MGHWLEGVFGSKCIDSNHLEANQIVKGLKGSTGLIQIK